MTEGSFLQRLHVDLELDAESYRAYRFAEPGGAAQEVIDQFEVLAAKYPPGDLEVAGRVPQEAMEAMHAMGFFGLTVPQEYGGLGLPFTQYLKVVERIGPLDLSLALVSLAHLSIGLQGIVLFGSEEQKHRYLSAAARDGLVFAYALTEPAVGSDAKHIRTTARLAEDGTHYLLNGQKTYITNANYAGAFTVFAQIEGQAPGHMGAFIVEREADGLSVGADMPKMGLKASSTAWLRFEDVRVPAENLLGEPGQGFRVAMSVLNYGRLAVAAAGVGLMRRSLADMEKRAREREQFGVPIRDFELIREKLVAARVNAFIGATMVDFAARQLELDPLRNVAPETSHCKLFVTTRAWQALYDALQVAGGSGYLATNPYEKRMRDWRVATIFEGTTEIHSIYPAALLLRTIGARLPKGALQRLRELAAGLLRGPSWDLGEGAPRDSVGRRAARQARACGRWFRILARAALLVFGAGVGDREFLLRRLTWLSLYEYGLLCGLVRVRDAAEEDARLERLLLEVFTDEARQARWGLIRLWPTCRERLIRSIAKRTAG